MDRACGDEAVARAVESLWKNRFVADVPIPHKAWFLFLQWSFVMNDTVLHGAGLLLLECIMYKSTRYTLIIIIYACSSISHCICSRLGRCHIPSRWAKIHMKDWRQMCVCVCVYVLNCLPACMPVCERACGCGCVCVCVCAWEQACMPACLQVCAYTYIVISSCDCGKTVERVYLLQIPENCSVLLPHLYVFDIPW